MLVIALSLVFFKQKTAYEMRLSDWSSDVCSSDLVEMVVDHRRAARQHLEVERLAAEQRPGDVARLHDPDDIVDRTARDRQAGMRGFEQLGAHRVGVGGDVDPVDLDARGPHLAPPPVGQAPAAPADLTLAFLAHPPLPTPAPHQVTLPP